MTETVAAAPGELTEITPPRVQGQVQLLVTTGRPPTFTLIEPGSQAVGNGVHGTGVGVPRAAAVAAMNAGFVGLWHMPKGGIFMPGTVSVITAIGIPPAVVGRMEVRALGAMPNVQLSIAPLVTGIPNDLLLEKINHCTLARMQECSNALTENILFTSMIDFIR